MLRPVLLCALALSCSSLRAEVQVLPVQRQEAPEEEVEDEGPLT